MPKYNTKVIEVDAIRFDGTNADDVLSMVGYKVLDLKGDYEIPNFVKASDWLGYATEEDYAVWTMGSLEIVYPGSWIMLDEHGAIRVVSDWEFRSRFVVPEDEAPWEEPEMLKSTDGIEG